VLLRVAFLLLLLLIRSGRAGSTTVTNVGFVERLPKLPIM
jgi:hypothetical protein